MSQVWTTNERPTTPRPALVEIKSANAQYVTVYAALMAGQPVDTLEIQMANARNEGVRQERQRTHRFVKSVMVVCVGQSLVIFGFILWVLS